MSRPFALSLLSLLLGGVLLTAQDAGSGPKEGAFLPKPFGCYNFNGAHKGKFHCLVCDYALNPVVLVFAREPEKDKDLVLNALLKRLDDATNEFKKQQLKAAVVFLSADAQSSATNPAETDPKKLVEEAKNRDALYARLSDRAATYKGVDVAVYQTPGPKDYDLDPKAEVSIVIYNKLRVVLSRAYEPGKLSEDEVDKILAKVKDTLEPAKKK
jgi:hypothetical protein